MRVMGDVVRLNAKRYPDNTAILTKGEKLTYRGAQYTLQPGGQRASGLRCAAG